MILFPVHFSTHTPAQSIDRLNEKLSYTERDQSSLTLETFTEKANGGSPVGFVLSRRFEMGEISVGIPEQVIQSHVFRLNYPWSVALQRCVFVCPERNYVSVYPVSKGQKEMKWQRETGQRIDRFQVGRRPSWEFFPRLSVYGRKLLRPTEANIREETVIRSLAWSSKCKSVCKRGCSL